MANKYKCDICDSETQIYDCVDFNRACCEKEGTFLTLSGTAVYYYICKNCKFVFAPDLCKQPKQFFQTEIYNKDYIVVDPDFEEVRALSNSQTLHYQILQYNKHLKHLDYGAGNALMTKLLKQYNYNSKSYEPMETDIDVSTLGRFDLITAIEVFEHVPDVNELMKNLTKLLKYDGIVLFGTLLSDNYIEPFKRLTWWYAAPRNGHISLFSKKSLQILSSRYNLKFESFSEGSHIFYKELPKWAEGLLHAKT
jgi:SAM-dependent methyltransferase